MNAVAFTEGQRLTNDAVVLMSAGRHEEAVGLLERATALEPGLLPAVVNLATTLHVLRRPADARKWYLRAAALDPGFLYARVQALSAARETCRFTGWEDELSVLSGLEPDSRNTAPQLDLLFLPLPARLLRRHAEAYAAAQPVVQSVARRVPPGPRLRIGYFSDEVRDHVVGSLLVEVLELHDRGSFDVHLFGWGPAGNSIVERRVRRAGCLVHDLSRDDDGDAARRIAAAGIDLLVDLKGYTTGHRMRVLRARPAPVQVSWLGYPGTLGDPAIDYLLVDGFAAPEGFDDAYTEALIRLPHTFMPADRRRPVASAGTRAMHRLPPQAVVLCYLGKSAKITPDVFEDWLDIVAAVPDGVLWLRADGAEVRANLEAAAAARGFPMQRLVFASDRGLRSAELNGRYLLADLALDSFPYGSHTTASEALWAGCPLVTRAGETLPSRIAGSLLRASGLGELVTTTREAFRDTAIALGRDPARLRAMRAALEARQASLPAFDTPRFTRELESAYRATVARYRAGLPPAPLWIDAETSK